MWRGGHTVYRRNRAYLCTQLLTARGSMQGMGAHRTKHRGLQRKAWRPFSSHPIPTHTIQSRSTAGLPIASRTPAPGRLRSAATFGTVDGQALCATAKVGLPYHMGTSPLKQPCLPWRAESPGLGWSSQRCAIGSQPVPQGTQVSSKQAGSHAGVLLLLVIGKLGTSHNTSDIPYELGS